MGDIQYDMRVINMPANKEFESTETHTAESKWQYCGCKWCRAKRFKLESMPGAKIDWDKFRLKDEKY
jgi:hypothetical protein